MGMSEGAYDVSHPEFLGLDDYENLVKLLATLPHTF